MYRLRILTFLFLFLSFGSFSHAAVPKLLHYQGHVRDGQGIPLEGEHRLTFRLYAADVGGNLLWTQDFPVVNIAEGNFAVLLDVSTADPSVDFNAPYWLSIEVDGDGEMTPRQQIASSAYSINADTVDGIQASATATANTLLPLDANAKFPKEVLDIQQGPGGNFNADTVDGFHAAAAAAPNKLLPLDAGAKIPLNAIPQGPASGLDADKVDGKEAAHLLDRTQHTGVQPPSTISPQGSGSGLDADNLDGVELEEIYTAVDSKIDVAVFPDYEDGIFVVAIAPTEKSDDSGPRVLKEFSPVLRKGVISVEWHMRKDLNSPPGQTALFINGSQIRPWISKLNGTVIETTVEVQRGDIIQVFVQGDGSNRVFIKDAKILCGNPIQPSEVK